MIDSKLIIFIFLQQVTDHSTIWLPSEYLYLDSKREKKKKFLHEKCGISSLYE